MRSDNLKNHIKTHDRVDETPKLRPWGPPIQSSIRQRSPILPRPHPTIPSLSKNLVLNELHDLNKGGPENSRERSENISPYSKNYTVKNAEREGSEKIQDIFRKLNTSSRTPLDFQPVGEKPPHDDKTSTEEEGSSQASSEDGRSSIDV